MVNQCYITIDMKLKILKDPTPKVPKVPQPTPMQVAYVENYEVEGMTKKAAAIAAGYSPNSPTGALDRKPGTALARKSVEEQRAEIQKKEGFSFVDVATRVKNRAVDPNLKPKDQLNNDIVLIRMLGFEAAQKQEIKTVSLIAELGVLTQDDITALCGITLDD